MTLATPRRTWPTLLFTVAAVWFALVSMLPCADRAWRAVAGDTPSEPGLQGEATRLLTDAGIAVSINEDGERGTVAFSRGIEAASHPLRLDILFDPQRMDGTRLVATEALSRGLGTNCLSQAVEPLVRREASGGDRIYLASLAVEVVQAAYEADRFGKPVLPNWLLPGMAVLCGSLAWLSHRLGRISPAVVPYVPSMALAEDRRGLEAKLARIVAEIAATRSAMAERESGLAQTTEPTWRERLNVVGRVRGRREAARMRTGMAALMEKAAALERARTAVVSEISGNYRRQTDDRRRFYDQVEDRALMIWFLRQAVAVMAIMAVSLAAAHATVAFAAPGALISPARFDEVLLRGDTLIATALEANPDLAATVAVRCFARVVHPEPRETKVANVADQAPGGLFVDPPTPWRAPIRGVQHCLIGNPCGNACIPVGRVCHVGQPARVGQECGRGYISMAKTCRVDRIPPPVITPLVTLPMETGTPSSGTSAAAYVRPDDAPRYIPPPSSGDADGGGAASIPSRTAVPAPTVQPPGTPRTVHVEGYDRLNGTHVQSHDRAAPGQGTGRGSRR